MRKIAGTLLAMMLPAVMCAATRVYDVDVYSNVNGWTSGQPNVNYISQSFVCTADSFLWAEFFAGALPDHPNGNYTIQILDGSDVRFAGNAPCSSYRYVRAVLEPEVPYVPVIKGKQYVLKITHSNGDNINWYADSTDPYKYGSIEIPGDANKNKYDLACRIEGINRPVGLDAFTVTAPFALGLSLDLLRELADSMRSCGVRHSGRLPLAHDWVMGDAPEPHPAWQHFDSIVQALCEDSIEPILGTTPASCQEDWAAHARRRGSVLPPLSRWDSCTPWFGFAYEPVIIGDTVVRANPLAEWTNEILTRYAPTGSFWTPPLTRPYFPLRYLGLEGEPNLDMPLPYFRYYGEDTALFRDKTYRLQESLLVAKYDPDTMAACLEFRDRLVARYAIVMDSVIDWFNQQHPGADVKLVGPQIGGVSAHSWHSYNSPGREFLRRFYELDAGERCDIVSVSLYQERPDGRQTTDSSFDAVQFQANVDTVRAIMRANGDTSKELWAVEYGFHREPIGSAAEAVPEAMLTMLGQGENPAGVLNRIGWFGFSSRYYDAPDCAYCFTDSLLARKPMAYALAQLFQEIRGKRLSNRLFLNDGRDDSVRIYELEDTASGKKTWVGWGDYALGGTGVSVEMPARCQTLDTAQLARSASPPSGNVTASIDGWLQLTLDALPRYVTETSAPLRPDLIIDSIWVSVVPGSEVWPQKRRFWVKVRNIGNATSMTTTTSGQRGPPIEFYVDGNNAGHISILPGIPAGDDTILRSDDIWQVSDTGHYVVKAGVCEDRRFVELNWDNNAKYQLLDVSSVYMAEDGVNGRKVVARASSSSPAQAVAEFTESGGPTVYYCPGLDSTSGDWFPLTHGQDPSISLDGAGNPWLVYLRGGGRETLLAAAQREDGSWKQVMLHAGATGQHLGPPSLGVFPGASGRLGNVAFELYDSSASGHSMILFARFDTLGSATCDTISECVDSYGDSAAVIAVAQADTVLAVYQENGDILLKSLLYPSGSFGQPDTWSSAIRVNADSTTARHPSCEKTGGRLYVSFTQSVLDESENLIYSIQRTSCSLALSAVTWEGMVAVSDVNTSLRDWSSLSTPNVVTWAESSGTHWVIKANANDSVLALTSSDSNTRFCSVLADTGVKSTPSTVMRRLRYLWSQQADGDSWSTLSYAVLDVHASDAGADVTRYNNGRKLCLDSNDSLHAVWRTNQGSLYYSKMQDGVGGWNSSLLRSTGELAAIDKDYLNRIWVAEKDQGGGGPWTYDVIRSQNRASGSPTWTDFAVYPIGTGMPAPSKIGPVSIAACPSDTGGQNRTCCYLVWPFYETNAQGTKSRILMAKVSTTGRMYVDTLHTTSDAGDSFPSICAHEVGADAGYALSVTWQNGSKIYYKKTTNQDQPEFTTKRTWSGDYNLSNTQGFSRHPMIAATNDTVLISWVEGDSNGRILVRGQNEDASYDNWADTVNISQSPDTCCDYPEISVSTGDSTIIMYQKKLSSTNTDVIANVNFSTSLNISGSEANSRYPHCVFDLHQDSIPLIHAVWTEDLSPNSAEVGYRRWQLGIEGGGGQQGSEIFDPSITPMLFMPWPNPFNHGTNINYQTNIAGRTSVSILDITGRRVCDLSTTVQRPGRYHLLWTGCDSRQRQLPAGVYFVRLQTPNYRENRKLLLTQ